MSNKTKVMFMDVETLGLDPVACKIHQFSGALYFDGQLIKSMKFHITVPEGSKIEPVALQMSGKTEHQLYTGEGLEGTVLSQKQAYNGIVQLLTKWPFDVGGVRHDRVVNPMDKTDKVIMGGYNVARFDQEFLLQLFKDHGDKYFFSLFHSACLDVIILAMNYLRDEISEVGSMKLENIARYLRCELPVGDAGFHDAHYDNRTTIAIYNKIHPNLTPLSVDF